MIISIFFKLAGLNFFEADRSNKILLSLSAFIEKFNLRNALDLFLLIFQTFIILRLSCKNKNMKLYYIATILSAILGWISQAFIFFGTSRLSDSNLISALYLIFSFAILLFSSIIIDIKINDENRIDKPFIIKFLIKIWNKIKRPLFIFFLVTIYQILVMFLREITIVEKHENIYNFLLNFDYIILLLATYYIFLKKETKTPFKISYEFSLITLLHNLFNERPTKKDYETRISKIKENYIKFKQSEKSEKTVIIIFLFFNTLSELFNVGIIFFIATLNNRLIECIFIIIAFSMSRIFFKSFHLKSAIACWIVSNISFFILTMLSINVGVTYALPVILGVGLSFFTSLLVKIDSIRPYRGISEKTLLRICNKKGLTEIELNILIDFYCKRDTLTRLTHKYNYSQSMICDFKAQALKKIGNQ